MYSYPYFRPSFPPPMFRRYPPKYAFPQENINSDISKKETSNTEVSKLDSLEEKEAIQKENRSVEDKPIFEILGIKLYFDDLLILGLLFFLYSEGNQDQELFFALILLLFS